MERPAAADQPVPLALGQEVDVQLRRAMGHARPELGSKRQPDRAVGQRADDPAVDDPLRIEVVRPQVHRQLRLAVAHLDEAHAGPLMEGRISHAKLQLVKLPFVQPGSEVLVHQAGAYPAPPTVGFEAMEPNEIFELIIKADERVKYATGGREDQRRSQAREMLERARDEAKAIGNQELVGQAELRLADLDAIPPQP